MWVCKLVLCQGHGLCALDLPSCRSRVQGPNELGGVLLGEGVGGFPSAFWICSPIQSVQGKCEPEALFDQF